MNISKDLEKIERQKQDLRDKIHLLTAQAGQLVTKRNNYYMSLFKLNGPVFGFKNCTNDIEYKGKLIDRLCGGINLYVRGKTQDAIYQVPYVAPTAKLLKEWWCIK